MTSRNAFELRQAADHFREMCGKGDDLHIKAALFELAEEYEREALDLEGEKGMSP